MNSLEAIKFQNTHAEVEYLRKLFPLAGRSASIEQARDLLNRRARALILFARRPDVSSYPPCWEEDENLWCFCEAAPEGHELESIITPAFGAHPAIQCRFRDGELFDKLCPACRRPCQALTRRSRGFVGFWGSESAYEVYCELVSDCCGETPVRPNGAPVYMNEADNETD